jgi:hypothetical protein
MIIVKGVHHWFNTNGGEACHRCKVVRGSYERASEKDQAFYDLECRNLAAGMLVPVSISERRSKARKNKPDQLRLDI